MSADNYYSIRKDRQGFFVPVMGFASNDGPPAVTGKDPRFVELTSALEFSTNDYTEYGITIHEECYSDVPPTREKDVDTGHYPECLVLLSNEYQTFECVCETIETEWEKDYSSLAK
jgi:hypothetical protein